MPDAPLAFQPQNVWMPGHAPVVAPARRLTYTTPASIRSRNASTSASSALKMPAVRPYSTALASSSASSSESTGVTVRKGRNSSSRVRRWPRGRPVTSVGCTKPPSRSPPTTTAPSRRASSVAASNRSTAPEPATGPSDVAGSAGSPSTSSRAPAAIRSTSSSCTARSTTTREHELHFWPASP